MRMSLVRPSGLLAAPMLLAVPVAATAQEAAQEAAQETASSLAAASSPLQDIVITAKRRAEPIQSVPIAVTALSAETLDRRGIINTLGLIAQVPNMFGSNTAGPGSANAYFIRGLGSTETLTTFDPPVGTYIDEVYLSRQNGNNFAFFDVERVEVLRGPQGTLFGRNTTAGAVHVVLREPGDRVAGFVEAGVGAYNRRLARASIDLPLADMVALKLSGYWINDDGFAQNTTTGQRSNDMDMAGLRLAARIAPVARLTWHVALSTMATNSENLPNFECDPRDPANCRGRFLTTGMLTTRRLGGVPQYSLPISGRKANQPLGNEAGTTLLTSNIEWAGDNHRLNLISGYVAMAQRFALDFADGRGLPDVANPVPPVRGFANGGFAILNNGRHTQFTQEIKLSGTLGHGLFDYVAGIFLHDEQNRTDVADLVTKEIGTPAGLPLLLADRMIINGTSARAGYAQLDANLTAALTATAGIRYTDETRTFSISDNRASCAANPNPIGCLGNNLVAANGVPIPRRLTTRIWTPRFALSYRPSDDVMLFASATRGFRSGGWNAGGIRRDTLLPFDPETVWSYEGGIRSDWLANRLRLNLTGFVLNARGLQTPSAIVDSVDGSATVITQNVAGYANHGLELELQAAPVPGLNLYLNVGTQSDRYLVADTLAPNAFGIKAVRQQQLDCLAQLAAGRIPLAPAGPRNAPDCAAGIVDANGAIATPVRTPTWTLAFGGFYELPVRSAGILLVPGANIVHRSFLETDTANGSIFAGASPPTFDNVIFPANPFGGGFITGSQAPAHWQVQASLTIRTDDNNWQLVLECENCLDVAFNQLSFFNLTYISPPRSWMLRARRRF